MNRRDLFRGLAGLVVAAPAAVATAPALGNYAKVGENGPELVCLPPSGKIISSHTFDFYQVDARGPVVVFPDFG